MSFCTEGVCHIRLHPDGTVLACRYGTDMRINLLDIIISKNKVELHNNIQKLQNKFGNSLFWYKMFPER